jgi:hypothetical protein
MVSVVWVFDFVNNLQFQIFENLKFKELLRITPTHGSFGGLLF